MKKFTKEEWDEIDRIHQFDYSIRRIAGHVGACCGGVDVLDDNGLGSHTSEEIIRKIDAVRKNTADEPCDEHVDTTLEPTCLICLQDKLAEANAWVAELEGRVIEWAEVAGDLKAKLIAYEKDLPAATKARIALLELAYEDVQSQLDTEREIKSDYGKRIDDLVGQIAALKAQWEDQQEAAYWDFDARRKG